MALGTTAVPLTLGPSAASLLSLFYGHHYFRVIHFYLCIHLGNTTNFFSRSLVGESDLEQLGKIFNIVGTPLVASSSAGSGVADDSRLWPGVQLLPAYIEFEPREPLDLRPLFKASPSGIGADLELLLRLLMLDPLRRISADQVRIAYEILYVYCSSSSLCAL
jgi:hypothetical protein